MGIPFSNKIRIKLLDIYRKTNQLKIYKEYLENQYKYSKEDIESYQRTKFRQIFEFHYQNNSTYRQFVDRQGFKKSENLNIASVPILSKSYFRNHPDRHSIQSEKVKVKHSGGSSGTPLTYFLSKDSLEAQWPSLWRSFDLYGIQPCDSLMMIAGPSLFNNRSLKRKLYDYINRFTVVSAFDLSDEKLEKAYQLILKKRINSIYGYTSSVLIFLQFLQKQNYKIQLKAIFTTSEVFIPSVRPLAKRYCDCEVIDTYGANDGGVQAFECPQHNGYHLNFERCMVEIVDGELLLTDLLNTASPFIRYRVEDRTSAQKVIKEKCNCGRTLFRIPDIAGRINNYIKDVDSNIIHSEFFSHLFSEDTRIQQFQVVLYENKIVVNIIHDGYFKDQKYIIKYSSIVKRRIKMPFEFIFNQPVKRLANMKVPILWNSED